MAVLPRSRSWFPSLLAALAVHGVACGDPGPPRSAGDVDTAAAIGLAPPPVDSSEAPPAFASTALPADFPADFPVPPRSAITSASVQTDADGTFTNVTIMSEGDPEADFAWYRDGLTRAGWTVTAESAAEGAWSLHAEQGESYVDLTVADDPASGWTRADAAIWKIHP